MSEEGIGAEELARAQRYLIGTHAIGLQRKSAIAAALAFHEAYGQGWRTYRQYADQIGRVTVAEVQRAAQKYLRPAARGGGRGQPRPTPARRNARASRSPAASNQHTAHEPARRQNRNLLTNLILIFPLLIVYQLGVLLTYPMLNGADFVSGHPVRPAGLHPAAVPVVRAGRDGRRSWRRAGLLRRRQPFQTRVIVPIVLESTIYALTMGSLIVLVMTKVSRHLAQPRGGACSSRASSPAS